VSVNRPAKADGKDKETFEFTGPKILICSLFHHVNLNTPTK